MGGGGSASPSGAGGGFFPPAHGFGSEEHLSDKFADHGDEFGVGIPEEYEALALQHANRRADGVNVLEHHRPNGDRLIYDVENNWFGIVSSDGVIVTFFKPARGSAYWIGRVGGTR